MMETNVSREKHSIFQDRCVNDDSTVYLSFLMQPCGNALPQSWSRLCKHSVSTNFEPDA